MPHPLAGARASGWWDRRCSYPGTPVSYRRAPPTLGQHTDEVLAEVLDLGDGERAELRDEGVI